jgi:O-antigen/teichoic acid export membrane protein
VSETGTAASDKTAARTALLARLALRGSLLTVIGHVGGEGLRFASNLLLTRLLYPEAFGLMAIANAVLQGARMISDVGIRASIVQHARGGDPAFTNTAWTIQVLRGFGISAALMLLAAPLAALYAKPEAEALIRVVALAAAIDGFTSTAGFSLLRQVRPGRQIARDLGARVLGITATVTLALVWPSVWSLAFGALATSVAQVAFSFRMLPGYRNRFQYDREAAAAISGFGRWVMVASLMTYFLNQGDRLVLGALLESAELGVYVIAVFLAFAVPDGAQRVALNVLFPVYARLRDLDRAAQRREITRYRLAILAATLPALWALAIFGDVLVTQLYDPRYAEAGWMVRLLAVAMVPVLVSYTSERVLLARGDSFGHLKLQASQAALLLGGMACGAALGPGGARGVVLGTIAGRLAGYLPLALLLRPTGGWLPRVDAAVFAASVLAIGAGFAWRGLP